jgi:hypothetical protein
MRTLVIQSSPDAVPPKDLSDIIANGSTVVLVTEAPDEGFRAYVDRVVEWRDPELTIDNRTLIWPDDADEVRELFKSGG